MAVLAAKLGGITTGSNGRVRLQACLEDDDGIDDAIDQAYTRDFFFSEWEQARASEWSTVSDIVDIADGARVDGLNAADSHGPYFKAVKYALSLLHTFADLFEEPFADRMKVTASGFRQDVERRNFRVHLGPSLACDATTIPTITIGRAAGAANPASLRAGSVTVGEMCAGRGG